jgi:hypothetical protein
MLHRCFLVALALLALARSASAATDCVPLKYYGIYSPGPKSGDAKVSLSQRLREIHDLGANMIIATGDGTEVLDALPPGMLAVPGCSLMKKRDWQQDGRWDEAHARQRLSSLARKFAHDPRVYGICLTHEITEYADHEHRRWMYKLAKEYFPDKKVFHYYGVLWDKQNPEGKKVNGYGKDGEVETDVLFVSLPAVRKGRYDLAQVRRLEDALAAVEKTPGIPVWGQTSINADQKYVKGAETMTEIWGEQGDNMTRWADTLFAARAPVGKDPSARLNAFFWRAMGRFPYDLAYPPFTAQRAKVKAIGARRCQ